MPASASRRVSTSALADGALPEARTRVDRFNFGPPVGFPVQFRVIGPDPMKVRAIADQVRTVMARNTQIVDPHLNWGEQVKSIRLEVDQDRARALGLTPQDVSQMLQTLLTGYTVTQYREGIEHIDVIARAVPEERLELDAPAVADHHHAQRHRGAAVTDRAPELRVRGADPVAAQPRHRAHRARRHLRQGAGARCHQRGSAEACADQGRACRTAIASRPAARSRKASRRTARSWPCFRSWRSRCWRC